MAPRDEPNATGSGLFLPGQSGGNISGMGPRSAVSSQADIQIPKVDALRESIKGLKAEITDLKKVMETFNQSGVAKKMAEQYSKIAEAGTAATEALSSASKTVDTARTKGTFGAQPNVFQQRERKDPAATVKIATEVSSAGTGGGKGVAPPATGGPRPLGFNSGTSPSSGDLAGGKTIGTGVGNAIQSTFQGVTNAVMSGNPLGILGAAATGLEQVWGSLAGGSMQYAYNRINGPQGNMNAMLQLSQALAPNVTMMNAAGTDISMQGMVKGLGQRMPVMGTQQDMLNTILAGQSVGALMSGTPGRNAFFESTRQAQALVPGQAPGQIAGNIAGYIGNVKAQQTGAMMGEGAFTMVGTGGRYKTLAEWAHGITEFLKQHRPGGDQGKSFSKADLITQNFPGSNINTWFQFMQVPQSMVDYWWQYVLTDKPDVTPDKMTSDLLQGAVQKTRGINLGYEQLRTSTQATRRDYLMGGQMYGMYAANASANRRFNVAMQGTDQALASTLQGTNIGRMIALLPTPIMEMLMPILTQIMSSPVGAGALAVGGLMGDVGDPGTMPYGGPASVGWGEAGGTTTAHLSPDLAKRVQTMMAANPELQISSGYRDTGTQNRLRRNGAQAVGHPSRSAHTRGWAADIGPASQMGWLMNNAGKFGLQTAANYGEPWHIQRAGTPLVGDPGSKMPYGGIDIFDSAMDAINPLSPLEKLAGAMGIDNPVSGVLEGLAGEIFDMLKDFMVRIMQELQKPLENALAKFVGGGNYTQMIDKATAAFSQLMTAPLRGMMNLGGEAKGGGAADLRRLIDQPASVDYIDVPVVMGSGFTSKKPTGPIFGDPMPFGGPMSLMSPMPTTGSTERTVVVQLTAPITIQGDMKTGADARRMASTLLDHLEEQAAQRDWLST